MKIWPKQFHTKQCSAISSPFTSVLFAIFLAFSTGGKFLRPSQTPGGDIFVLFFFSSKTFWHLRLVLTVREPSAWYKSVATTLLPLVRQIDRYPCVYVTLLLCVFVFSVCALPVPDRQMELPATLHVLGSLPERPPDQALGNSLQVIFAFFRCVCNL